MKGFGVFTLGLCLILLNLASSSHGALKVGFYKGKCGGIDVEALIRSVVRDRFYQDRSIVAALLRMQFHDCFVTGAGCDASILLDGGSCEKTAPPNQSVRGYDLIDLIKTAVEKHCPKLVSCADIISVATRDAVSLSGKFTYAVETGRKDGFVSLAKNVDLPGPSISVSDSIGVFARKGINAKDMVLLIGGGHTVGITHCSLAHDRLYNYKNTNKQDPKWDPKLASSLQGTCPKVLNNNRVINLDQNSTSSLLVDNSFYKQIILRKGILDIDQLMAFDVATKATVAMLAKDPVAFQIQFGQAMVKLGRVGVLTDNQGEIRKSCRSVNPRQSTAPATPRKSAAPIGLTPSATTLPPLLKT